MTDTTDRHAVVTDQAPRPAGAYSQAIVAGDLIFTAGYGPHDPATGELGATTAEQTRQVLSNVGAALSAAGASLTDVVKTTVHLADLDDWAEFDAAYREVFAAAGAADALPARTTVGSVLKGIRVEVDAVAVRPS